MPSAGPFKSVRSTNIYLHFLDAGHPAQQSTLQCGESSRDHPFKEQKALQMK